MPFRFCTQVDCKVEFHRNSLCICLSVFLSLPLTFPLFPSHFLLIFLSVCFSIVNSRAFTLGHLYQPESTTFLHYQNCINDYDYRFLISFLTYSTSVYSDHPPPPPSAPHPSISPQHPHTRASQISPATCLPGRKGHSLLRMREHVHQKRALPSWVSSVLC